VVTKCQICDTLPPLFTLVPVVIFSRVPDKTSSTFRNFQRCRYLGRCPYGISVKLLLVSSS